MSASVLSSTLFGIDALPVVVETQIVSAARRFSIVGLPDGVLKEARDRVRCSIVNSGFSFPNGEVVVSLGPAALPKSGSGFDLAIALSVLGAAGVIDPSRLGRSLVLGELALDGSVRPVRGVLGAACLLRQRLLREGRRDPADDAARQAGGGDGLLIPAANAQEALLVEEVPIRLVRALADVVLHLGGMRELPLASRAPTDTSCDGEVSPGFGDVLGQHAAKRALEIAAAGGHNVCLVGPPGAGKSMLARRVVSLLPDLSGEESLEVTRIYSAHHSAALGGERVDHVKRRPPFRAPHHSTSLAGLIGGGTNPIPGEISLAHRGVLFLDELPEMKREAIESLREPLETRSVTISRARTRLRFPASFILVAAMNPCPCGGRNTSAGGCRCAPDAIRRYASRISGPMLDRIDLHVWVPPVPAEDLQRVRSEDPTSAMQRRVLEARLRQKQRNPCKAATGGPALNSSLGTQDLQQVASLDADGRRLLAEAVDRLKLSARGYARVLRVARTIADLEGADAIAARHVAETLSYRPAHP